MRPIEGSPRAWTEVGSFDPLPLNRTARRLGVDLKERVIEQIRIVVSGLSPLVADLFEQAIAREPDMVIVGRGAARGDPSTLRALVLEHSPEVLVVSQAHADRTAELPQLLGDFARTTVIAIDSVGGTARRYELRSHQVELGAISPAELVDAIRLAAHPVRGH